VADQDEAEGKAGYWGIFHATVPSGFPAHILYTSSISPVDGGDFNFSAVTAERMGQGSAGKERVRRNESDLTRFLDRPVVRLHQVHSNRVVDLDRELADIPEGSFGKSNRYRTAWADALACLKTREADAMVTTRTDCALAILTGDCTPVLCVDPIAKVFGAAHAGRRGVENGVVLHLLEHMASHGAHLTDVQVWIGPHICGKCYETGSAIADTFEHQFPGCSTLTRFGGPGVDMQKALIKQMESAGIPSAHIHTADHAIAAQTSRESARLHVSVDPKLAEKVRDLSSADFNAMCTLENPLLYSYRRWTLTHQPFSDGRFLNIICPL
jgi:YfiH family protein